MAGHESRTSWMEIFPGYIGVKTTHISLVVFQYVHSKYLQKQTAIINIHQPSRIESLLKGGIEQSPFMNLMTTTDVFKPFFISQIPARMLPSPFARSKKTGRAGDKPWEIVWVLWDCTCRGPQDLRFAKVPLVWMFRRFFVGLVCLVLFVCLCLFLFKIATKSWNYVNVLCFLIYFHINLVMFYAVFFRIIWRISEEIWHTAYLMFHELRSFTSSSEPFISAGRPPQVLDKQEAPGRSIWWIWTVEVFFGAICCT